MNETAEKIIKITGSLANHRIDYLLAKLYPHISRTQWQKRIQNYEVLVNNKKTKPSYILKEDDKVYFYYQKKQESKYNTKFSILYEDEYLIAVNKPPNLTVHPSGNYRKNTLNQLLIDFYKDSLNFCHPVHRLDRETSGIILYGKNPQIIKKMNHLFRNSDNQNIKKFYDVLVFGKFSYDQTLIEGYIGRDFCSKVKKKQKFLEIQNIEKFIKNYEFLYSPEQNFYEIIYQNQSYLFKYAKTLFSYKKIINISHPIFNHISLIKAQIFTGRTHQIRATLLEMGFPVVGDKIYGINEDFFIKFIEDRITEKDKEILVIDRTALHSSFLEFLHPVLNKKIQIYCEPPEDFLNLLKTE